MVPIAVPAPYRTTPLSHRHAPIACKPGAPPRARPLRDAGASRLKVDGCGGGALGAAMRNVRREINMRFPTAIDTTSEHMRMGEHCRPRRRVES